jgi:hypothetical protein
MPRIERRSVKHGFFEGDGIFFALEAIKPGVVIDTKYESNCVVAEDPQVFVEMSPFRGLPYFTFDAYDQEGVVCQYTSRMVALVHHV